jgi:acyl carrier protein
VALVNLYGPSETVLATWHRVARPGPEDHSVPIGHPIAGRSVLLLDDEDRLVPEGAAGEIVVRTQYAARGYLGHPDDRRFGPNPLTGKADDPVFRTGDRGRLLADGTLSFLGRLDRQVKVRGHRIDLGEIEQIAGEHPQVTASVAGVREGKLVLWVEGPVRASELRVFLAERLPAERIPGRVVGMARLPRGSTGKLELEKLELPPLPAGEAVSSELEAAIAGIWREVLGRECIGRDQNFFDLGGDSLAMAKVQDRLHSALSLSLPLVELFRFPTVADLAARAQGLRVPPRAEPRRRDHIVAALRRRRETQS